MKKIKNFLKNKKDIIVYIVTIILSCATIYGGYTLSGYTPPANETGLENYTAVVERIDDVESDTASMGGSEYDYFTMTTTFTARITSGDKNGELVSGTQTLDSSTSIMPKQVEKGDKIILGESDDADGNPEWTFTEYHRSSVLIWLCVIFFALLLLFGRKKGLNTVISLVFTCLSIFVCFVPAVLNGKNIYLWTTLTCLYVIIMTLLIINGANKKSLIAACGCIGGLAVTALSTALADLFLGLTGNVNEHSIYLLMLDNPIDLKGIMFAGIMIGALGAAMDVSMSLASSLMEVAENMEQPTFKKLVKSGFNIGRDIMGTMANTLILAYIGCELATVLLIVSGNSSLITIFNVEMIVVEVLKSIVGSFGILFTIPATSILAAFIYSGHKRLSDIKKIKTTDI